MLTYILFAESMAVSNMKRRDHYYIIEIVSSYMQICEIVRNLDIVLNPSHSKRNFFLF